METCGFVCCRKRIRKKWRRFLDQKSQHEDVDRVAAMQLKLKKSSIDPIGYICVAISLHHTVSVACNITSPFRRIPFSLRQQFTPIGNILIEAAQ